MPEPQFTVVWTDHYHFDVFDRGRRYLKDVRPSSLAMLHAFFDQYGIAFKNDRPAFSVLAWLKWLLVS